MINLFIFLYVVTSSSSLILVKYGTNRSSILSIQDGFLKLNISAHFLAGIFLFLISFIIYVYLISKNDLGYIIPVLTAFVYVSVFTASYFIFNEIFTPIKISAIILILIGVIILGFKW